MRILLGFLIVCSIACGEGGSPTAPTTSTPVTTPLFERAGAGATTFDLPATVGHVRVEIRSTQNSCHYFEVFIAQRLMVSDILGDCRAASGMSYTATYDVIGSRVDLRGSQDWNTVPYAWTVKEVR
jgi:hypothetical protein